MILLTLLAGDLQEIYCQQATTIKLLKRIPHCISMAIWFYTLGTIQMAKKHYGIPLRTCLQTEFYPGCKLTIGPAIDQGFYYDIDTAGHTVTEKDFDAIEKRMIEVSREQHAFMMRSVSKREALTFYQKKKSI